MKSGFECECLDGGWQSYRSLRLNLGAVYQTSLISGLFFLYLSLSISIPRYDLLFNIMYVYMLICIYYSSVLTICSNYYTHIITPIHSNYIEIYIFSLFCSLEIIYRYRLVDTILIQKHFCFFVFICCFNHFAFHQNECNFNSPIYSFI